MKNYLTIIVCDANTEIKLWGVRNVPASALFADNFKDELYDRFAMATGITPKEDKLVWHIEDAYDNKR